MIKLMRDAAHRYPWILKTAMGVIAVTFIVGMGWWGFSGSEPNAIASVGDQAITRDEYRRAYENTYRFYKDNVQGDFKEEMLKQFVIDGLIESKLWTIAAREIGVTLSPDELREDIIRRADFQRNGTFDPDLYRRILSANRLTPALFESLRTTELLREKAITIFRDSVALTPSEIEEAKSLMARQTQVEGSGSASATNERLLQDLLFQKQQRAVMAYSQALKARVPIHVHKELL